MLAAYAEQTGQTQTAVLRAFIRSLVSKTARVTAKTINPPLLPSVPLNRVDMFPAVAAVYFFIDEDGTILYVGQCANLGTRCYAHRRYPSVLKQYPHARLHWVEMKIERTRRTLGKACELRFKPPLNQKRIIQ